MKHNRILHSRSAPFKPSTNGLAEISIDTFRYSMRAMNQNYLNLKVHVNTFLIRYRNTPHTITRETSSKLFQGRHLITRLDLLKPDTKQIVTNSQMKLALNDGRKLREFEIGQT